MRVSTFRHHLVFLLAVVACRGESAQSADLSQVELDSMVASLMPTVERLVGLEFSSQPKAEIRDSSQIRQYLLAQLGAELPEEKMDGIVAAYTLLGMIPDTLDVPALFVELYTEQVAGFYDPDSLTFYAVGGTGGDMLRITLIHELVHALQHQHLPLDSILDLRDDADRLAASHAMMEGQAQLATMLELFKDQELLENDATWQLIVDQLSSPQAGMGVFNSAPLVIRSGLLFPYREGSTFMRWFSRFHAGEQPYEEMMPVSTEQILHPERFEGSDTPIMVRFANSDPTVIHEDTFGEYEMHVLRSSLAGIDAVATLPALGWGGDRYRVYRGESGPALVWYSVWDEDYFAERFVQRVIGGLGNLERDGYRTEIDRVPVGQVPGVRVVIAPEDWVGWQAMPEAQIVN